METKNASSIKNPNLLLPKIDKKVNQSPQMSVRSSTKSVSGDKFLKGLNKLRNQKHYDLKDLLHQQNKLASILKKEATISRDFDSYLQLNGINITT